MSGRELAEATTTGTFGMLGLDPLSRRILQHGTEVKMVRKELINDRISVELRGVRRFALLGEPWQNEKGFMMSRVEFLEEEDGDNDDLGFTEAILGTVSEGDDQENQRLCEELEGLVKEWIKLVVEGKRERQPGQVCMS